MAEILFGWVSGAIESVVNALTSFFSWLGQQLWNGLVWMVNSILGFFEWIFNSIRGLLPYVIFITLAWFTTTRILRHPTLSIGRKAIQSIGGIGLSAVLAYIFDALVPKTVSLPRLGYAILPPELTEAYSHKTKTAEAVSLVTNLWVFESKVHSQTSIANAFFIPTLEVSGSMAHSQAVVDIVDVRGRLDISDSKVHSQALSESVQIS